MALPPLDVQAPLMSLPSIFHTKIDTIPAAIPYLQANPELVERWRRKIIPLGGFKIGIVWQGRPEQPYDRYRSIPLANFAPLARLPGVRLISLQKGQGREQLPGISGKFAVHELADWEDEPDGAFMNAAAIIRNLDLVISCDTSVAHLAGALGAPLFVALPLVPDWRWLLHREGSPWYTSAFLFRKTLLHDWEGVFERIAERVHSLLVLPGR